MTVKSLGHFAKVLTNDGFITFSTHGNGILSQSRFRKTGK